MSTGATSVTLIVGGRTGLERAEALDRAFARWLESPTPKVRELGVGGPLVEVSITNANHPTSIRNAVSYAKDELERGVSSAGGSLADQTHVQLKLVG